jgi:hypothetical protein
LVRAPCRVAALARLLLRFDVGTDDDADRGDVLDGGHEHHDHCGRVDNFYIDNHIDVVDHVNYVDLEHDVYIDNDHRATAGDPRRAGDRSVCARSRHHRIPHG